jgi:hypothetical protein
MRTTLNFKTNLMQQLILLFLVLFCTSSAYSQSAYKPRPIKIVAEFPKKTNNDTIYLKSLSIAQLNDVVKNNAKVLVHIWYPWCREQQDEVEQYAAYQKEGFDKNIRYLFIADNKHTAGTIPYLFYKMNINTGYIIPQNLSLKDYKKALHKFFMTKNKKHVVFSFKNGALVNEGYSYEFPQKRFLDF